MEEIENEILKDNEIISNIEDFLRSNYEAFVKSAKTGVYELNFEELDKVYPDVAELLLSNPSKFFELANKALANLDLNKVKIRVFNLPSTSAIKIRDIRSKHIGKLIQIEGIIRLASDVRPVVKKIIWRCPKCNSITEGIEKPLRCIYCGYRGRLIEVNRILVDTQRIVVEEVPELLEGGEQAKRIACFLREDLVDPSIVKKTCPGSRIKVVGIVKEVPIPKSKNLKYDLVIEANNVIPVQQEFEEIELNEEDIDEIIRLSKDPELFNKLINSFATSIYGYREIKEAIILQLFGGCKKIMKDGTKRRGDIHILLVGDPGTAKSQLLKSVLEIAPKARYVSGKGASGVGLTAAVVKDEFLKGWSLEAGALVLANHGIVAIDEIDKMSKDDRVAMHEALELQTVTISKANIHATLIAETSVLAAANPKFGRFDRYRPVVEQIDLPPTLVNRFDLIFVIQDIPDKRRDALIAEHMLRSVRDEIKKGEIDRELLRKYIAYARKFIKPKLTIEAMEELKNFYVRLRNLYSGEESSSIPISPRQLEALVRLSEASAKARLSEHVTKEDAKRAIDLLTFSLKQVGIDPETGRFDIDYLVSGISSSQRSKITIMLELIDELGKDNNGLVKVEELIEEAKKRGISEAKALEIIEKLKRSGEIYEPKTGEIKRS